MATETEHEASGPYAGVLGYLSSDAQAAVFRYLPHLEKCVDDEVDRFGQGLGRDLKRLAKREANLACQRLQTARKGTKEFKKSARAGQRRLGDLKRRIDGRAEAAIAQAALANESATVLGRVRAFAQHVAEFPVRGAPEGLLWAMEDLKRAHEGWGAAVARLDAAAAGATEETGEQEAGGRKDGERKDGETKDGERAASGEQQPEDEAPEERVREDDDLGEIERLMGRLASGVRSLQDAPSAPPPAADDDAPGDAFGGDATPSPPSPDAVAAQAAAAELAALAWELPGWLQEAQRRRTEAIAAAAESLQRHAAATVKDTSNWRAKLERLLGSADQIETVAGELPKSIHKALLAGIKAAKLDVCGGRTAWRVGPGGQRGAGSRQVAPDVTPAA